MSGVNARGGVVLALWIGVAGLPVGLAAAAEGPAVSIATGVGATRGLHNGLRAESPPSQPPDAPEVSQPEVPGVVELPAVYSYDSEGRRDPFVSLLARGSDLPSAGGRPAGLVGLSVNEVALRGVVFSGGVYVAVLEAPDNKTYIVRTDDRLYDGSIKEITADAIIFLQEVNDPLSLVTEREVRKGLRDAEEGR
jgi:Tfp pilus assembly protein PilP